MSTDAQLKRYSQLNQLQAHKSLHTNSGPITHLAQKRIAIPFSKQKKALSKQMLISDHQGRQRNGPYNEFTGTQSSKTLDINPLETLSTLPPNKQ